MRALILLFILLIALPLNVFALEIQNSPVIEEMKSKVLITGSVELAGSMNELDLNISIPQEDSTQSIENITVNHDYKFVTDGFGNKWVELIIKSPLPTVTYSIEAVVNTKRKVTTTTEHKSDFMKPTSLVQSTDPEIISLAQSLSTSSNDFEKLSTMTMWVNANLKYDIAYAEVNLTAKEVLKLKKGVCDEFSTLLLSLARSQGYSAAYAVGYAFGRGYTEANAFNAHGWTEIYAGENGYVADPTWMEGGFIDATHIKFLTIPDGVFTLVKASASGYGDFNIKLSKINVEVTPLEIKESPIITTTSALLSNQIWNGYAVVRTELSAQGCFATKVRSNGCTINDKEFLEPANPEQVMSFCNDHTVFSIFKPPVSLEKIYRYNCPLSISPVGGEKRIINVSVSEMENGDAQLTLDKESALSGEEIMASAPGAHLFTDNGQYGFDSALFKVPSSDFKIYAYDTGALVEKDVAVVKIKPLDISLKVNETLQVGKPYDVLVSVKNLLTNTQSVTVKFKNHSSTKEISGSELFNFTFVPSSIEDNLMQVFIKTDSYSTVLSKLVNVIEVKRKGFIEDIISAIASFFNSILKFFK